MAITSISQLKKLLEARIQKALEQSRNEIYAVIKKHLVMYYQDKAFRGQTSNIPVEYDRTERFLESLIKTKVVRVGNSLACNVQLDEDYLDYKYPGNPERPDNVPATGLDVATWANESSLYHTHGYTVPGTSSYDPWWDVAMEELGGKQGILNIMKKNLKAVGIPLSK